MSFYQKETEKIELVSRPGRRHDDGNGSVVVLQRGLGVHVPEEGEEEGQGFPTTRLGYPDHVGAGHHDGDPLGLQKRADAVW